MEDEVKNITELKASESYKLPQFYVGYSGSLDDAFKRLLEFEPKLMSKDLEIIRPYRVFRIEYPGSNGKPHYQYAFELRKTG